MEERLKYVVYACCAAAGLSFLVAIWAVGKASLAQRDVAALTNTRVAELEASLKKLKDDTDEHNRVVDSKLVTLREDADQLSEKISAVRAGRQEAKEYANRKHQDALDTMEGRLRSFGGERNEKLKGLSDRMGKAQQELEKRVEERCKTLKGYVDKRLSVY